MLGGNKAGGTVVFDDILEWDAANEEWTEMGKMRQSRSVHGMAVVDVADVECQDPCSSKQCGPHSGCTVENNEAVCHCQQGFLGSPPNCEPECVQNSDCPSDNACVR